MVNLASMATISITKQMYGWTKYGGARKGVVKEELDIWYCQCCGEKQTAGLPSYMHHMGDRDYVKLCSKCWNMVVNGSTFTEIKVYIRRGVWVDNLGRD